MKLDKILKLFIPKDESFFPLFTKDAQNLVHASELLKSLMLSTDIEQRGVINKQIKEAEHIGDEITYTIFEQLNKSFITPFDREDIQEFAARFDNVVDAINGISQRVYLYVPKKLDEVFYNMAEVIHLAALEIEIAVNGLKDAGKNKEKILKACNVLNQLEKNADDLYHTGISNLFNEEKDTIEIIKKKAILETLEKCSDKTEDISDTIKTILIKMS